MATTLTPAQATKLAQEYVESQGQVWTALSPSAQADEVARVEKTEALRAKVLASAPAAQPAPGVIVAPAANQKALARVNALRAMRTNPVRPRPPGVTSTVNVPAKPAAKPAGGDS